MPDRRVGTALFLVALLLLPSPMLAGALVQKMDLSEVCSRATQIFRGTVVDVTEGEVVAGGATLPTVTYRIKVTETFKGSFTTKGDETFAEVTMLGRIKEGPGGSVRHFSALPELPRYDIGSDYVLMLTAPSAIGLSAPVGLGQGSYAVWATNKVEMAQNAIGKALEYGELAAQIRALIGR